ncbi:MAG TPA: CaiB/BaiF CoA-transferase family protein [Dehalococcoidia bacterium]|nr:CaiB/BaiF CoA-transferase family protein [Dehalococcoidia bacterium]
MLPLDNIRVLDLTRLAPGPHCTMILADLGADVIRIEEPGGGRRAVMEREREADPQREQRERRLAAFRALDRNKRSVALNLKAPEALAAFYRLADRADVVIEGYRPGVVKRLGVDFETLAARNPRLVYCSISGYGQQGPYRLLVGHDINYAAMAGALSITGPADGPPYFPANLLGDYAGGGMHAVIGILTALWARERTGRGQYVDISMTEGILTLLAAALSESYGTGEFVRRGVHRLTGALPYYGLYRCKDGQYLSLGANEPWFYDNLMTAVGRPDLAGTQGDTARREEVRAVLRAAIAMKTRDEWFAALQDKDVCVAPVYELDELERDPQIAARQMLVDVPHPEFGTVKQVGVSVKLSETPGAIRSPAPQRGQHTEEVLREAGLTDAEIEALGPTP